MSDTTTPPKTSRARQLLTAAHKAPRKLRIAAAASLIAAAGTAALVAVPAAANASTVTTTPNPTCAVPAGVSYTEVERVVVFQYNGFLFYSSYWEAYSNGVYYNGYDLLGQIPPNELGGSVDAICSTSSSPLY